MGGGLNLYQELHDRLSQYFKEKKDFRLTERRLNFGSALRHILKQKRLTLRAAAKLCRLNSNTLHSMMTLGEINTTQSKFLRIIEKLKVPADEFIRIARESAHYNFYQLKLGELPIFKFRTCEIKVYSPPSFSRKDFLWCHVLLKPKQKIANLIHSTMDQVGGFVTNGRLHLKYGNKIYSIHANQTFFFDPKIKHSFTNEASTDAAGFHLLYQLKPTFEVKRGRKSSPKVLSTSLLISQVQKELSPDPNKSLPLRQLAASSGIRLDALEHLRYRKTKIIPFEKIDRLANLTDYSFQEIIQKAENRYSGWITIFTDHDKAKLAPSPRYGSYFTVHTGIGTGKRKFSIIHALFKSWKEGTKRKEWKYRGTGFIGLLVERGILGIQYGTQPLKALKRGETLYLNADCDIAFMNFLSKEKAEEMGESAETKVMMISSPPFL